MVDLRDWPLGEFTHRVTPDNWDQEQWSTCGTGLWAANQRAAAADFMAGPLSAAAAGGVI